MKKKNSNISSRTMYRQSIKSNIKTKKPFIAEKKEETVEVAKALAYNILFAVVPRVQVLHVLVGHVQHPEVVQR
jgi:hypothetical protein